MMKKTTIVKLIFAFCIMMTSCTSIDEYLNIVGKDEITYPGKIDSVVVYSGNNRVLIEGLCISDAKVVSCEIVWNLGKNNKVVPVDMSNGTFKLSVELELPESIYNFDLYTLDIKGNRSIPVNVSAQVYGDSYQMQIGNRLISDVAVSGTTAVISWYPIDITLGPLYTEVTYTMIGGKSVTMELPLTQTESVLENIDKTQPVVYKTFYKPEEGCLDIFETDLDEYFVE